MMKGPTLAFLFALYSFSAASAVDPLVHLKLSEGMLELVTSNSDICSGGPLKIVGDESEKSLMLGPTISFPMDEETDKGDCSEKVKLSFSPQKISRVHIVSQCPPHLKKLESNVEEILTSKDKTLTYERKSSDTPVKCTFKWAPVE
jgi:hypothetical protein